MIPTEPQPAPQPQTSIDPGTDPPKKSARLPQEIQSLTTLRGYLAAWVVVFHFWVSTLQLFPQCTLFSPLVEQGYLAVPGFFVLSGFVLAYNYGHRFDRWSFPAYFRFMLLRLGRIYPVHIATLAIVGLFLILGSLKGIPIPEEGYQASDLALNLLLMQTWVPHFQLNWNHVSWSISSEWFAYLLFPPLVCGVIRHIRSFAMTGISLLICIVSMNCFLLFWRPWPYYELLLVLPTFLTGVMISKLVETMPAQPLPAMLRWLPELGVVLLILAGFLTNPLLSTLGIVGCLTGIIMILAALGPSAGWIWRMKPGYYLGEVSYSLYMAHPLAQRVAQRLLPSDHYAHASLMERLLIVVANVLLVAGATLAVYWLVEQPCRIAIRKRSLRVPT